MPAATIGVGAQLDSALRRAFSDASIRLKPDTRMTDVVEALGAMGVTAELEDGNILMLRQGTTELHTVKALRNFVAMPQHEKFIVVEGQHPYTWSLQKKVEYLRTHTAEEYRTLCQSPVLEAGVRVLDANMSREDYDNLTTKEKVQFIREFGAGGVRLVMSKPRKATK